MVCNVQVWNEEDAEDEVLAMVARTGLRTTVGNLLRQVMSPVHATQPRKDIFVVVSYHHKLKAVALEEFSQGGSGGNRRQVPCMPLSLVFKGNFVVLTFVTSPRQRQKCPVPLEGSKFGGGRGGDGHISDGCEGHHH